MSGYRMARCENCKKLRNCIAAICCDRECSGAHAVCNSCAKMIVDSGQGQAVELSIKPVDL